jgi:hypothetical protein
MPERNSDRRAPLRVLHLADILSGRRTGKAFSMAMKNADGPEALMGGVIVCGSLGCSNFAEATLDGLSLCRNHFYDRAMKRIVEYRDRLQTLEAAEGGRNEVPEFLSQIIAQTTMLVTNAKFLGPGQRDQFLELSLSAMQLFKRAQRPPRLPRNMPVLLGREADLVGAPELTNTVDVSKRGACVATVSSWAIGDKAWIQKPVSDLKALARIAWSKKTGFSQFLVGLDILDAEDFWKLESASPRHKRR